MSWQGRVLTGLSLWGSFTAPSVIPIAGDFSPAVVLEEGGHANQYWWVFEASSVSSRVSELHLSFFLLEFFSCGLHGSDADLTLALTCVWSVQAHGDACVCFPLIVCGRTGRFQLFSAIPPCGSQSLVRHPGFLRLRLPGHSASQEEGCKSHRLGSLSSSLKSLLTGLEVREHSIKRGIWGQRFGFVQGIL